MNDTTVNDDTTFAGQSGVDRVGATSARKGEQRPIRRLFLAGLGAAALGYDAAEQTFDRFVAKGREVQDEMGNRVDDVRRQNMGTGGRVGDSLRMGMDTLLNSLNLPSKTDIDTVNVKLNILTRKVDDLQTEETWKSVPVREAETPPVPPEGELGT